MQDSPNRAAIKKERGGLVLCFSNSCHLDCLLAVSLDNLLATETNPIGRSVPVRSKRETRAFREFEGELWDGWRKRGGVLSSSNSADKQGSGPLLLLIKGAVVLCHLALRGVSAAKGMFKTAACFLRIFPPAPCFSSWLAGCTEKEGTKKKNVISRLTDRIKSGPRDYDFHGSLAKFPIHAAHMQRVN